VRIVRAHRNCNWIAAAIIVGLAQVSGPTLADPPPGKGKGKGRSEEAPAPAAPLVSAGIPVVDARRYAVESGGTGYKPLPPGIRRNLARGKALPPGIAKKYAPAPMLRHLPVHPGYEWRAVGTDLVLVAIATAVVADILIDVFL